MRIINVVTIKEGVDDIQSFGVFEEQLSDEVVEQAEKVFTEKIISLGVDDTDEELINSSIDDGYYLGANFSVAIEWTDSETIERLWNQNQWETEDFEMSEEE